MTCPSRNISSVPLLGSAETHGTRQAIQDKRSRCGSDKKCMRCSRCKFHQYCSQECQRADWPTHKRWCDEHAQERQIRSVFLIFMNLSRFGSINNFYACYQYRLPDGVKPSVHSSYDYVPSVQHADVNLTCRIVLGNLQGLFITICRSIDNSPVVDMAAYWSQLWSVFDFEF